MNTATFKYLFFYLTCKGDIMSEKISEKKGMVSERMLEEEKNKTQEVPAAEVTLVFIAEYLHEIRDDIRAIRRIFEKEANISSAEPTTTATTEQKSKVPVAPSTPAQTPPQTQAPPSRVAEVVEAFKEFEHLVILDTEESAQFIKVKPRQFLGSQNFAKIAKKVKEYGGQYVSKGRESHFVIPKRSS